MKSIEELQAVVTDARVHLIEEKGVYYAVVVEENGDEHDLARSKDLDDLHQQLKDAGVAN